MVVKYLTGNEKVLEIGGNIGRNSLIIAYILGNRNNFVTLECDENIAKQLEVPLFVSIATNKKIYKPNIQIFDKVVGSNEINKSESFYVGDALGRKTDFADSDKVFAENIGIKYYSPEDFFGEKEEIVLPNIPKVNEPEIVIMVGYPASGKSTIAHEIFEKRGYEIISGDVYKTTPKMLRVALPFVLEKKSIVFDATNSSKKKRSEYVTFAKKHNYSVRCIHVQTSMEISYKRNKMRAEEDQIPKIAYSVYTKHFEEPSEDEGFHLIKI
jgi:bifunctional polynucleotide phosphatase/kinase